MARPDGQSDKSGETERHVLVTQLLDEGKIPGARNLKTQGFAGFSPNRAQTYQVTRVLQWGNPTIFKGERKPLTDTNPSVPEMAVPGRNTDGLWAFGLEEGGRFTYLTPFIFQLKKGCR